MDQIKIKGPSAALALAALGVVYGDIGTSPLYALKEVFNPSHGIAFSEANVIGGVSAVFWALMIVVAIKYVTLIMRAHNHGEGGIMALVALVAASVKEHPQWGARLALIGVFGAALFYGDGVITPAISVLSAIEGLEIATPLLKPYVVPLTLIVLIALFAIQRSGTSAVGTLFGPIMMIWFAVLALVGIVNIAAAPRVLEALNPVHGVLFLSQHGWASFLVLGAVFLAVTGGEALYADMGHFGSSAIRVAWFGCVFPALALNYLGQGALLLGNPKAIDNPFYLMFPNWALYPMVGLATVATVIASQAVISGTYSMTKQAIQLGFLPRANIVQTSAQAIGQIYIPSINWALLAAIVAAVIGFGSSSNLASAYGLAVSGTMLITTLLTFFVVRYGWKYNLALCILSTGFFLVIDAAFFSANFIKLFEGGWFPLAAGIGIFTLMTTWRRGRSLLYSRMDEQAMPLAAFIENIASSDCPTVSGTAVFLTTNSERVPHALLHSLKHYKALHERVVLLTVISLDVPRVARSQRVTVECMNRRFYRLKVYYGFMDEPDLPDALEWCAEQGLQLDMMDTSFFLGRETLIPKIGSQMPLWREKLFIILFRNAGSAAAYFKLPPNRVVELGSQVVL